MPDISMCQSRICSKRKICNRNKESGTKPSTMQSYAHFKETIEGEGCSYFWALKNDD